MGRFAQPITINEALLHIAHNNYLLPAFQRDFKWEAEDIELLFDSIMQGFPISSMLFWKIDSTIITNIKFYYFSDSFIENQDRVTNSPCIQKVCSQVDNNEEFLAVLDGQQRLTALRIGLYGKYYSHIKNKEWDYQKNSFEELQLFFNLSKVGSVNDDIKYYFKFFKFYDENESKTVDIIFRDKENNTWYNLTDLQNLHPQVEKGVHPKDFYKDFNLTQDEVQMLNQLHDKIYKDNLINYYKEDTKNIDTAFKIFTRINNGGKKLPIEEIIYSLIKSNWSIDARIEIEGLIASIKNTGFNIGLSYIIKAFLVLYSSDVKYQLKTFDIKFCNLLEKNWNSIKSCILELFETLKSYGMSNDNLTAPNATIIMLYYIYHKNLTNFSTAIQYDLDRKNMKDWLYSVFLRRAFGAQGDTVLTQARSAFNPDFVNKKYISCNFFDKKTINSKINKIALQSTSQIIDELLYTEKDNAFAFIILSLLFPNLDYQNGNFHKDHMHPFSTCKNLNLDKKEYNSIVNLQLLDQNENKSKQNKPLKQWVDAQILNKPQNYIDDFYDSHIIPQGINLDINNFKQFYDERKKILSKKLSLLL
ncbi:MAG: DUF262 domain-containing protein [Lachnospiraceae bacterium]|nr:DUF262 domain-containing protein [Lachnospiraceae bacterium]